MNYRDFTLGDWIGHISGVIEDETTLDGNEMRDLVEFLTTMQEQKQEHWDKNGACPFCGYLQQWDDDNYCGHCGAKLTKINQDSKYEDLKTGLEQIRAEISKMQTYVCCHGDTKKVELSDVLELIDKAIKEQNE